MRQNHSRPDRSRLMTHLACNRPPAADLAFEMRLLETGAEQATLFIYEWSGATLVIGKGQVASEIDYQTCVSEGVAVLRRETGGTAVLHNQTLNIGLVLPSGHGSARNIGGLYSVLGRVISLALTRQGVSVTLAEIGDRSPTRTIICFESHSNDSLLLNGRKVFGGAQRRLRETTLVHGTLLLAVDIPQHSRVFGVQESRIEKAMTAVPDGVDRRVLTMDIIGEMAAALELEPDVESERGMT